MKRLFIRFPGGKPKALTFSYDDGVRQDLRLLEIFNKYGLHGTFNLNSSRLRSEAFPDSECVDADRLAEIYAGHEIAVHGVTHPFLGKMTDTEALYEMFEDRLALERLSGRIVRGMAYPFGSYTDATLRLAKAAGIVYSRTVDSSGNFLLPNDWLRLAPTCHHAMENVPKLCDRFLKKSPNDEVYNRDAWLFYIWGHSFEFDDGDFDYAKMGELCRTLSGKDDVWYATNLELYEYIEAFRGLIHSADGKTVYNPFAFDLYGDYDEEVVVFPAGKTVILN